MPKPRKKNLDLERARFLSVGAVGAEPTRPQLDKNRWLDESLLALKIQFGDRSPD
jgi:hypothetical protein